MVVNEFNLYFSFRFKYKGKMLKKSSNEKSEFEFTFLLKKTAIIKGGSLNIKLSMKDSLFAVPSQTFRYLFQDFFIGHHSSAAVADTDSLLDFLSVFPAIVGYLAV